MNPDIADITKVGSSTDFSGQKTLRRRVIFRARTLWLQFERFCYGL
jgi:hypothetical protein